MKFISLTPSTSEGKKYRIIFSNPPKTIHFGSKGSSTYLDHKDIAKRKAYIARHRVNEDWTKINAGSLSRFILWGNSTSLRTNLLSYLNRFNISRS
jgi:hypothetical protein